MIGTTLPRTDSTHRLRLNWIQSFLVVSLHACGLLCFWFWPRAIDLALFVGLYFCTTFAIGIGYHRLLTHRGFKCNSWMRRILTWMGAAALQGGPARWARIHRRHHQATDKHGDPHTPLMGFLHAHMGWILRRDAEEGSDYRELVPDVSGQDAWLRVLDKGVLFTLPWFLTAIFCLCRCRLARRAVGNSGAHLDAVAFYLVHQQRLSCLGTTTRTTPKTRAATCGGWGC